MKFFSRAAALAAAGTVLLAGCAGGGASNPTTGAAGGTTSPDVVAAAKKLTEENFAGTDRELPKDGPKAVRGKTVWALVCSTAAAGCMLPAQGFEEAGKELGWNVKIVDGKLDPSVYNTQIRSATAAGVDAIALFGTECASTESALKAAKAAGVLLYAANAVDCDDKFAGGTALYDAKIIWDAGENGDDYEAFLRKISESLVAWVIAKTEGKANVLVMVEDDTATTRHIGEDEVAALAKCGGCVVNTVPFTAGDLLGGRMQAKTSAALQKYPDANVVMVPTDATNLVGVAAGVQQVRAQGREILLVGQEGVPAAIELIRKGEQSFALGRPWPWTGWASADGLNRLFAGEKQVDPGFGFGSMDADHLPAADVYDGNPGTPSYKDNYRRIWGVLS